MYRSLVGLTLAACVIILSSCSAQTTVTEIQQDSAAFSGIRSKFAPGELTTDCKLAIQKAQIELDNIAAAGAASRTVDNTLLALERITADLGDATTPLTFMGYVSPDTAIAAEGSDCEQRVNQYFVTIFTRADLYNAIKDQKPRNANETRLLQQTLLSFEKNGLKLDSATLAQVKDLKQKLAVMESSFSSNLNKDTSTVTFTEAELAGVPADDLARFKRDAQGGVVVTTKAPDFDAVADNATSGATRKKMYEAYYNIQADANTQLLTDAVNTRRQIAKLMGYATWADYQTDGRMAKNAKTVMDFLNGLKGKLSERTKKDLAQQLARKQKDDATATALDEWDLRYYANQLQKETYSIDEEKIREYFPSEVVMKGLFEVYSQLLGVSYVEVLSPGVWAPGVKLYEIINTNDQRLIGYFYTDFIPRDGKYDHFASFPIISARVLSNGQYSKPVAAIVGNFSPASPGKPSLMSHDEVTTVFHEFGHIMHQTLTKAPYASLSGSNVAQDFVEAPSQMLENWTWDAGILSKMSGHYKTGEKLPQALLDGMLKARDFNQGYLNSRQLTFALFDMDIHMADAPVDVTEMYKTEFRQTIGLEPLADTHFPASFGHIMGGYDAGYYGYMWSLVYAQDMFTRFQQGGLLSPEVGADYRKWILEKGNMIDAIDVVRGFLGREPNSNAFYQMLGINADPTPPVAD
jgi:thimet oligopeptidase